VGGGGNHKRKPYRAPGASWNKRHDKGDSKQKDAERKIREASIQLLRRSIWKGEGAIPTKSSKLNSRHNLSTESRKI